VSGKQREAWKSFLFLWLVSVAIHLNGPPTYKVETEKRNVLLPGGHFLFARCIFFLFQASQEKR
jgi:hypothetical protein